MKLSYAKITTCFALLSLLLVPTPDLVAQRGGNGPSPDSGPGPGHMNWGNQQDGNFYGVENLAYYGDWNSNRVFIIDVDDMSLLKIVEDTGEGPYGVDQQDGSTAYALTRKTKSVTVIENYYIENIGRIFLDHKPRSTNFNPHTGLSLVSGADKVMSTVIHVNSDRIKSVYGVNKLVYPDDFGGSLATGHPLWISGDHFLILDRADRQIELWSRTLGLRSVIDTPASVHHVFQAPYDYSHNIFYAVIEGNQELSPSILRFKILQGEHMVVTGEAVLRAFDPDGLNTADMGSHHADFHPDGVHIYVGSAEGHVFVVNKNTMEVVTMIDTGLGSGHTTFVPLHNRAFVTNHNDRYMTVIDTTDHSWLTEIKVAETSSPDYKSQAHTSGVSADQNYFYSAASHDGVFFRIEVDSLQIKGTLNLEELTGDDVNILMGSFIWNGEGQGM